MEKIWKMTENIIRLVLTKIMRIDLQEEAFQKICQFIKFGVVGISNTLISYVVYVVFVAAGIHYLIGSVAGFCMSVVNAYYWNSKYVFATENTGNQLWWKALIRTFIAYAGTGLILNNFLLIVWVDVLKINEVWGPIINLLITVPINFGLNKYWAFRGNR